MNRIVIKMNGDGDNISYEMGMLQRYHIIGFKNQLNELETERLKFF